MSYLFILIFFITGSASAKCLNDIYSIGLGLQGINYELSDQVKYASKQSASVHLTKIIYCPRSKWEFRPYLSLQYAEFEDDKLIELGKDKNQFLYSFGSEVVRSFSKRWEWLVDLGIRSELSWNFDKGQQKIVPQDFVNLKFLLGARYHIWGENSHSIFAKLKLGALSPLDDKEADRGGLMSLSADYLLKLNATSSLVMTPFFDYSSQGYRETDLVRTEAGIIGQYLFRY